MNGIPGRFSALIILGADLLLQSCGDDQTSDATLTSGDIERAFKDHQSNIIVTGRGQIVRLLSDDLQGTRHQRFIIKLASGHTLLISHNIDLAPGVSGLQKGELVDFRGEYEWNNKGGVVHWTHRDANGRHEDGWLEYRGKRYQ